MKFWLLALFPLSLCGAQPSGAAPVVLNWSIDVTPGDAICLQGSGFGNSATVWCSLDHRVPIRLPLLSPNSSHGVVQAKLPGGAMSLYGVFVKNGAAASNTVYLNGAKPMHFDTPEVAPGGTFRIFGRNLSCANSASKVELIAGTTVLEAAVTARSENTLTVTAPAVAANTPYTVKVWNGLGSAGSDYVACPMQLTGRTGGADSFGIGVPWGVDFAPFAANVYNVKTDSRLSLHAVGDGAANDQPAIQAAIDYISSHGGGVAYLPAGNFKMLLPGIGSDNLPSGVLLKFAGNVVVQGAGEGQTTVSYGYETNPSPIGGGIYLAGFFNLSDAGLCDLTVQDVDAKDAWVREGSIDCTSASRVFLARITYDLRQSQHIYYYGDRMVVTHCTFSNTSPQYADLIMVGDTNSRVSNNKFTARRNVCVSVGGASNTVVEQNSIVFDLNNNQPITGVRHGIVCDHIYDVAIVNNTISTTNGIPVASAYNNDGESILSENPYSDSYGEEFGRVTSASGLSLTVTGSTAYAGKENLPSSVVIVSGTGLGQWRTITGRSGSTITVDRAWAVAPDSTSSYAVTTWGMRNVIVSGNRLDSCLRGIWLYGCSAIDTEISGNTLAGMDGIWIQPWQSGEPNGAGKASFEPVWNTQVHGNMLSSRGTYGTYVSLDALLSYTGHRSTLYGTLILNDEVKRNRVIGSEISGQIPNNPAVGATPGFTDYNPAGEGLVNYFRVEDSSFDDLGVPALLGSIFMSNTVANCSQQTFLTDGGAYSTVYEATMQWNDRAPIDDVTAYGNVTGHTSVDTVSLSNPWAAPTVYEFESGVFAQGAPGDSFPSIYADSFASNGHAVGGMNTTGDAVTIGNIPGDGKSHRLTVRYSALAAASTDLYLNGTLVKKILWPPTLSGSDYFGDYSLAVTMPSGSNSVMLRRDGNNGAVDLDKLVLN